MALFLQWQLHLPSPIPASAVPLPPGRGEWVAPSLPTIYSLAPSTAPPPGFSLCGTTETALSSLDAWSRSLLHTSFDHSQPSMAQCSEPVYLSRVLYHPSVLGLRQSFLFPGSVPISCARPETHPPWDQLSEHTQPRGQTLHSL